MVMKRYPHGAGGEFFFMKRAPQPRPDWIETCAIEHGSGNVIDFPVVQDLPSLLWLVNLGCIDLNQWYARCDDVDRPDYLHFDLDPVPDARSRRCARRRWSCARRSTRSACRASSRPGSKGCTSTCRSSGARLQKQVWTFAKALALTLAGAPGLVTAEYRVAKRPAGHVLVDYNQNAWGRTLASVYSVRPRPLATVSTPVTWDEVERGVTIEDLRVDNVPGRLWEQGDLWAPGPSPPRPEPSRTPVPRTSTPGRWWWWAGTRRR
jgi:bifunctional non-homologous end joining protein LigD